MDKPRNGVIHRKIRLRNRVLENYKSIIHLQLKCFPEIQVYKYDPFENILRMFPEGQRRMYDWRKKYAATNNLKRIAIGGRLPNYQIYLKKMNVYNYANAVIDKKIFNPVLSTQLANGFALKKVLPDYLPADKESCRKTTYLEWANYQYHSKSDDINSSYIRI